jgi:Cutinase
MILQSQQNLGLVASEIEGVQGQVEAHPADCQALLAWMVRHEHNFFSPTLTILEALTNLGMMSVSDLKKGDFTCKKAALIFARGTGEPGNMGYVVGPGLASGLKKAFNNDILIQGADYTSKFWGLPQNAKTMAHT